MGIFDNDDNELNNFIMFGAPISDSDLKDPLFWKVMGIVFISAIIIIGGTLLIFT